MVLLLEATMDMDDTASAALLPQRIRRAFLRPAESLATALRKANESDKQQKNLKKLRAALDATEREGKPTATFCEQYCFLFAEDGDWYTALSMFSRTEGHLAEITMLERSPERQKGSAVLIADYWWDRSATDTAANGRKVWECYVLGLDPENVTNNLRITGFAIGPDGKPVISHEPSGDTIGPLNLKVKVKGKEKLSDPWQEVMETVNPAFRFFTISVDLP